MLNYYRHILLLFKKLGIVLLLYSVCRVLFFLFYRSYFPVKGPEEFLLISLAGMRFDLCAICIINSVYIVFAVFPAPFIGRAWYRQVFQLFFYVSNGFGLAANCADLIYFRFVLKRLTLDAYTSMKRKSDFNDHLSFLVIHNWYAFVICAILITAMVIACRHFNRFAGALPVAYQNRGGLIKAVSFYILLLSLNLLSIRGGTQLIPISIADAGEYASPSNLPLVLNSPFSIFKTVGQEKFSEPDYMSDAAAQKLYPLIQPAAVGGFRAKNVVVVILESFSKEYTGIGGRRSYTPFLDSLMKSSLVFTHAFANGKRSAEGIPAILAGIPTLMNEAYNSSVYADNEISSLATLLKTKGYTSFFFHGGTNGTMNFQSFTGIAGFDAYYGRREYNNEKEYDGHWGIWDEPFLQYFAAKQHQMKEPFLSAVFTLSSHDPYLVPEQYKTKFPEGSLEIYKSIAYSDYALRLYFNRVKNETWFKNTLFVFAADHTGVSADPFYANDVGQYNIPIVFYSTAGDLKGLDSTTMQQLDIMPSVLSYLGYDKPYFSFGRNVFDARQDHFAINFCNNMFQLYHGESFMQFDGRKVRGFYNLKTDSLLQVNKAGSASEAGDSQFLQAVLQKYEEALIQNRMTAAKQRPNK
jgi:phosphoglycerol transferase MdoB-like AlkP superfamily enzyme